MFIGKGYSSPQEAASNMVTVERMSEADAASIVAKLLETGPDWKSLVELLHYFWKVKTVVEGREYGIMEEVDFVTDTIKLDFEQYLMPENLIDRIMRSEEGGRELLKNLIKMGLIEGEEYDRVVVCPKCGSFKVRVKLVCPHCKSFRVTPTRLIQHVICGYSGPEAEFKKGEEKICPSCNAKVAKEGIDYIVLGRIFYCEDCKRIFKNPKIIFECGNKETLAHEPGFQFEPINSNYVGLKRYKITNKGAELIESGELLVNVIAAYAKELKPGIEVYKREETMTLEELNPEIRRLGFSLVLKNPDTSKIVAIDFATSDLVPFIMKATILKNAGNITYFLLSTPTILDKVVSLNSYASGANIIDITDHSLREIAEITLKELE